MGGLTGRVAMVTGGGVGIGRAAAIALARDGADVAVHYHLDEAGAKDAARAIEALGRRAVILQADLTKSAEVARTIANAERQFGRIDILVNNAGGIIGRHPLVDITETFFHDVMNLNVLSMVLCSQAVAPGMIARRHGAIVNLTSLAAHNGGGPGASIYAAAKAAVLTLTKAWAKELAPHGIRVNAVAPGLIGGTPFHRDFTSPEVFAASVKTIPLGRAGEPDEVAKVIAFLAGDAASFLVGETVEINGGMYHAMKIARLRWLMVSLVFLATVINYIDRQTVSVLKTAISTDLGLSNADYAAIQNSFLVMYGISQMVSGRLYDRIGTRLGFIFSIVVWSAAAVAHALARTAGEFRVFRGMLGFGEAGNWPGAAKLVGEWFPVKERALGMGIFNAGAALGGAVSPPIIAWLALTYGWRSTFVVTGVLGFAWLLLWMLLYRVPAEHPWITDAERAYILSDRAGSGAPQVNWRPGWMTLLTYRQTWALVIGRFITDPIWWLYVFWLPSYFQEARGFSLQQIGLSAWLPFLCAGVGALGGGWASGFLIQRGWSVDRARKTVMAFGALLTPAGILAMRVESPYAALFLMGIVLFGFQVWINNLQTLPSDFFPKSAVGSVFGLGGTSAAVASVLYNWGTGHVVDAMGYTPVFVVAGVLGPLGLVVTILLAGRVTPLEESELR